MSASLNYVNTQVLGNYVPQPYYENLLITTQHFRATTGSEPTDTHAAKAAYLAAAQELMVELKKQVAKPERLHLKVVFAAQGHNAQPVPYVVVGGAAVKELIIRRSSATFYGLGGGLLLKFQDLPAGFYGGFVLTSGRATSAIKDLQDVLMSYSRLNPSFTFPESDGRSIYVRYFLHKKDERRADLVSRCIETILAGTPTSSGGLHVVREEIRFAFGQGAEVIQEFTVEDLETSAAEVGLAQVEVVAEQGSAAIVTTDKICDSLIEQLELLQAQKELLLRVNNPGRATRRAVEKWDLQMEVLMDKVEEFRDISN